MKIEFLNPDCTEAIVTRGWWRKRQAHVKRGTRQVRGEFSMHQRDCWVFAQTGRYVGWWVDGSLDADIARIRSLAEQERIANKEWVRVDDAPKARLLERRS